MFVDTFVSCWIDGDFIKGNKKKEEKEGRRVRGSNSYVL